MRKKKSLKKKYQIRSERYNHTHKLVQIADNVYMFLPEQEWMPIYITKNGDNKIIVDTEGGPCLYIGWSNDEIEIIDIYEHGSSVIFKLKEK